MEPAQLAAKLLKARESTVDVDHMKFIIRRPAAMKLMTLRSGAMSDDEANKELTEHVVGWQGVKECDVIRNGASDELPFDHLLFRTWVLDEPRIWTEIIGGFNRAIKEHEARVEALRGNSSAPSN